MRSTVKKFAEAMEKQLEANNHKGHWRDCTPWFLVMELNRNFNLLTKTTERQTVTRRCANIANFAMMIADNYGDIEPDFTKEADGE